MERVKLKKTRSLLSDPSLASAFATRSMAEHLASLPVERRENILSKLSDRDAEDLLSDFAFFLRPKQRAPEGNWSVLLARSGRGWGKTYMGSAWVHERAMSHPRRWIAIVARTPADARDFVVEGPGGLLRNAPRAEKPDWEPSKRRLTWPNGSWATIFSDEQPDQLRGFSGDTAWLDEFAKFQNPEDVWNTMSFGMREASTDRPRVLITTTPRPLTILNSIEKMPGTIVVTGSSFENRTNLDPKWLSDVLSTYEGTRLGRQEIHAEYLDDVLGALWTRAMLDKCRFQCGPITEIRKGHVAVSPERSASVVGVWSG
jgi:phage terminase large subunit-like protein